MTSKEHAVEYAVEIVRKDTTPNGRSVEITVYKVEELKSAWLVFCERKSAAKTKSFPILISKNSLRYEYVARSGNLRANISQAEILLETKDISTGDSSAELSTASTISLGCLILIGILILLAPFLLYLALAHGMSNFQ